MDLLTKSNPTKEEYIYIKCLQVLGQKKMPADKLKKMMDNDENK
jgi:hypothetical protein